MDSRGSGAVALGKAQHLSGQWGSIPSSVDGRSCMHSRLARCPGEAGKCWRAAEEFVIILPRC